MEDGGWRGGKPGDAGAEQRQPAGSEPPGRTSPAAPYNLIFPRARRSIAAHLLHSAAPRGGGAGEKGGPGEPSLRPPPAARRRHKCWDSHGLRLLSSLPRWHPGPCGRQRGVCRLADLRDLALKEPERRLFTLHYQPGAQVPAPRGARPRLQVPPLLPTAQRSPHERRRGGSASSPPYLWPSRGGGGRGGLPAALISWQGTGGGLGSLCALPVPAATRGRGWGGCAGGRGAARLPLGALGGCKKKGRQPPRGCNAVNGCFNGKREGGDAVFSISPSAV